MKDKWMNITFENDELKPYEEPSQDFSDSQRIDTIVRDTAYNREQVLDSLTSRKYDDIMAFYLLLAEPTSDSSSNLNATGASTTKGVTDASNLASKVVSASTRPSTTTTTTTTTPNDKENLPSIDKHRPMTAAVATPEHSLNNGAVNGVNSSLLTSSSIDASTANNGQHLLLKTSASGGPPVSSMIASNSITSRTNTNDKIRSQTVRLPGSGVRRRETIDPVPGGMSIRKVDANEKPKTPTGDTYVPLLSTVSLLVVVRHVNLL